MPMQPARYLGVAGALLGAGGVALSAVAAHAGGSNLETAARFMLLHAPLLVALGLVPAARAVHLCGLVILAGIVLFCGDLIVRSYGLARLFPMAAPAGGVLMILGWLALAGSVAMRNRG
jgi:uncharacterized membrane protein YgdD (TMEM256/DUF423 family)